MSEVRLERFLHRMFVLFNLSDDRINFASPSAQLEFGENPSALDIPIKSKPKTFQELYEDLKRKMLLEELRH